MNAFPSLLADAVSPGLDGFLGTRASIMLDVVFVAMFAVLPVMTYSLMVVKRTRFALHKLLQLALGSVLLVAVLAFEIDMRFFTDWTARAAPSPYFQGEGWNGVWISLAIHLAFAVPTLVVWIAVISLALRRFPAPPQPGAHSHLHMQLGWLAALGMTLTAATGWVFYWLAFVAV